MLDDIRSTVPVDFSAHPEAREVGGNIGGIQNGGSSLGVSKQKFGLEIGAGSGSFAVSLSSIHTSESCARNRLLLIFVHVVSGNNSIRISISQVRSLASLKPSIP